MTEDDRICTWTIRLPLSRGIKIILYGFDLNFEKTGVGPTNDALQIYMDESCNTLLRNYEGNYTDADLIHVPSNKACIKFLRRTEQNYQHNGFSLGYEANTAGVLSDEPIPDYRQIVDEWRNSNSPLMPHEGIVLLFRPFSGYPGFVLSLFKPFSGYTGFVLSLSKPFSGYPGSVLLFKPFSGYPGFVLLFKPFPGYPGCGPGLV
uniref:CUB domain-containing protein n=1 Tax=Branchiostoma floridae TaxID=7739 RepID=C3ZCR0_BRAFL|eukprot:XP_002593643.1 hypothetical protein BRAFLDRAFT_88127 [Branchiostoma floridae]